MGTCALMLPCSFSQRSALGPGLPWNVAQVVGSDNSLLGRHPPLLGIHLQAALGPHICTHPPGTCALTLQVRVHSPSRYMCTHPPGTCALTLQVRVHSPSRYVRTHPPGTCALTLQVHVYSPSSLMLPCSFSQRSALGPGLPWNVARVVGSGIWC